MIETRRYALSANGALANTSLGQRARNPDHARNKALKARFSEAHLRRLALLDLDNPGRVPQARNEFRAVGANRND